MASTWFYFRGGRFNARWHRLPSLLQSAELVLADRTKADMIRTLANRLHLHLLRVNIDECHSGLYWFSQSSSYMTPLPRFENPPVIETVLGVAFDRIPGWDIRHFGLFWDKVRTDFPGFEVRPPIEQPQEAFPPRPVRLGLKLSNQPPDVRCWFVSDDSSLIQIQRDRFLYNWRKGEAEKPYPHYEDSIRPAFQSQWEHFNGFLKSELGVSELTVSQCEVSYVNHIKVGEGWKEFRDIFPVCSGKLTTGFLPKPEQLSLNVAYALPDESGRLRLVAQPAFQEDGTEIVQFNLTCRGQPKHQGINAVMSWMDLGREWIVKGFVDFTSEAMHKHWKLRR